MNVQHFNVMQCPEMPWKNGGGTTREIVCSPAGSDMSHFDWRISIAKIDQNGPFSSFEGIDRTIMLLEGSDVRLQATDGQFDHLLARPLEPFSFAGEVALDCTLQHGSTHDFNVMTRRKRCHADTHIVREACTFSAVNTGLLLAAQGAWTVTLHFAKGPEETTLSQFDGMWWQSQAAEVTLHPATSDAALIAVQINNVGK